MFKKLIAALAILISAVSLSGCSSDTPAAVSAPKAGIIVEEAFITAINEEGNSYVYAKVTNRLNATITLIGGSTDSSAEATVTKNGMDSQDTLKDGVDIHVGQSLELSETGKHLTIQTETTPIHVGDKVLFTFKFKGAASQTVTLTAK
jgi:copper(I)-binding protein